MLVYGQIISKILVDLNMKIIINLELSTFKAPSKMTYANSVALMSECPDVQAYLELHCPNMADYNCCILPYKGYTA